MVCKYIISSYILSILLNKLQSTAIIYCFNTDIPKKLSNIATKQGIQVRHHNVIYKLIDDLKEEINKKLPPLEVEDTIGI